MWLLKLSEGVLLEISIRYIMNMFILIYEKYFHLFKLSNGDLKYFLKLHAWRNIQLVILPSGYCQLVTLETIYLQHFKTEWQRIILTWNKAKVVSLFINHWQLYLFLLWPHPSPSIKCFLMWFRSYIPKISNIHFFVAKVWKDSNWQCYTYCSPKYGGDRSAIYSSTVIETNVKWWN